MVLRRVIIYLDKFDGFNFKNIILKMCKIFIKFMEIKEGFSRFIFQIKITCYHRDLENEQNNKTSLKKTENQ